MTRVLQAKTSKIDYLNFHRKNALVFAKRSLILSIVHCMFRYMYLLTYLLIGMDLSSHHTPIPVNCQAVRFSRETILSVIIQHNFTDHNKSLCLNI